MKTFKSVLAASVLAAMGMQGVAAQEDTHGKSVSFTLLTGDKVSAVARGNNLSGFRVTDSEGNEQVSSIFSLAGQTYVVPPQAQPYIDNNTLDIELFNISKLYRAGFEDASNNSLSVIVRYQDDQLAGSAAPRQIAAASLIGELELIDSAAYQVDKTLAKRAFTDLVGDTSIQSIWLDAFVNNNKIKGQDTLEPTVPLTGALGEFARQYDGTGVEVAILDSGYDVEHADLQGQVIASADFSNSRNGVDDIDGHGTHVASTVAGTGAESNGMWAGVAPGSKLIVGKVLGNSGSGSTYGIMQGMQWAVDQGADVINMSLGGSGTSCSGPLVEMVEALSDDALFVISAGNSYSRGTVGIPGCAPSALTVAAIDRNNDIAVFSSRGPSPDGHSSKPDIASQGVNVVAAASGGTGSYAYQALSGTSMASPHVAGGAAIAMQARPDLTPQEIKHVLTSSVTFSDEHVLEQGAGPMDINQAVQQAIISPANIELGQFALGDTQVVSRTIELKNISGRDIEFTLNVDMVGDDGHSNVPSSVVKLDAKKVTIKAGQSHDVELTITPKEALKLGAYGTLTGRLTGVEKGKGSQRFSVPVSMWVQAPTANVTFDITDHRGLPADAPSRVFIINEEDDWGRVVTVNNGQADIELEQGDYSFIAHIMTFDNDGDVSGLVESAAQMSILDTKVTSDKVVALDARNAKKVTFEADDPIAPQGYSMGFNYVLDDAKLVPLSAIELAPDYVKDVYVWSKGHDDRFTSFVTTRAVAPETVITTASGEVLDYVNQSQALAFSGEGEAELVYVEDGGYDTDWSQYDVDGKVALIANPYYLTFYMVKQAKAHGAVGVLFYRPGTQGRYKANLSGVEMIPAVTITAQQGEALRAAIDDGEGRISWSGVSPERSPYAYSLHWQSQGKVQSTKARFSAEDLEHIESTYYSQGNERRYFTDVMTRHGGSGEFYSTGSPQMIVGPITRDEYFLAADKVSWTNVVMPGVAPSHDGAYFDGERVMEAGKSHQTSWFKAPKAAALNTGGQPFAYRDTNLLGLSFAFYGDGAGHDAVSGYSGVRGYRVLLNGEPAVLESGRLIMPDYASDVTVEVQYYPRAVGERSTSKDYLGSFYHATHTFMSDPSQQGIVPVLMPNIDLPLSIHNTANVSESMTAILSGSNDVQQNVALSQVTLEYGYGDQCLPEGANAFSYCSTFERFDNSEFVPATVTQNADGTWHAELPNDGEAGQYVHLRLVMEAADGTRSEQVIMRAYKLQ